MNKMTDAVRREIKLSIQRHTGPDAMTWAKVVLFSERICPGGISRQTLSKDEEISEAYDRKKNALRGQDRREPRSELDKAKLHIKNQNATIRSMKEQIRSYDEMLVRLIFHAKSKNVTIEQLDKPLGCNKR